MEHYREILVNALEQGYQFRGFHQSEFNGRTIYLRHDLDISIEEAMPMANLEAELGIRATYFFLVNSPVYNPISAESLHLLHSIQNKGHWLGLHIDPTMFSSVEEIEEKISRWLSFFQEFVPLVPVISFHRPDQFMLGQDFSRFINVYSSRFFKGIKYLSDSRGVWREGCPCQRLKEGVFPVLQLLIHPIWWGVGETQGQKLHSLLEGRLNYCRQYLKENIRVDWGDEW